MALKPCPRCGKMISDKAERCPQCGLDVKNLNSAHNPQYQQNNSHPTIIDRPLQQGQPTIIDRPSQDEYPTIIEYPKKSKRGLWIFLSIILVVGIGAAIWIPIHHHNEKLKAEQLAIIEQQRLDSIAAVEEQIRQDSIEFENTHRLTADIWFTKGDPFTKNNWVKTIKNMDFEPGKIVNTGKVDGEVEYELFDSRYIPYYRTINGRKIEIRDHQYKLLSEGGSEPFPVTNSEWVGGTEIDIIFYDKNDYEDLKKSLKSMGLKKKENYWTFDFLGPDSYLKYPGETCIFFKENKNGKYIIILKEMDYQG